MFNFDFDLARASSRIIHSQIEAEGGFVVAPEGGLLEEGDDEGNISWLPDWLEKPARGLINLGKTILGWAGKILSKLGSFVSWSFSTLVGWISSAASFIWNFDWNISEQAIDQQLKSSLVGLAGQAGGFVGQALGWAFCGAFPGLVVMSFNEALGLKILKDVGEEAFDELAGSFGALLNTTFRTFARYAFMKLYASARRMYWKFFRGKEQYPDFSKRKPWSFASAYDDWTEKLGPAAGNAAEELREEFAEACTEAGYVVAQSLDAHFAAQALLAQQQEALNPQRIVEVQLRRT